MDMANVKGPTQFPCPACGGHAARVKNSRVEATYRRRHRECACGHRYVTVEIVETDQATAVEKQTLQRAKEALAAIKALAAAV